MGGKPSIPTDPSRQVEVIGAGFSRTGTVTFSLAMERLLNGPVMHAGTQMLQREDGKAAPQTFASLDQDRILIPS